VFVVALVLHRFITLSLVVWLLTGRVQPSLVGLDVGDDIDVSPVNILESAPVWVRSDSHCLVDTRDLDPVTGLHIVDQVFIGANVDGLGCLTLWDTLWSLLHLDVLLVGEDALVVDDLEGVTLVAILTEGWLLDTACLDAPFFLTATFDALEVGLFHLGNDVTVADDDASEGDELINVVRVQLSDPVDLPEVVRSDLDDGFSHVRVLELHLLVFLVTSRHNFHADILVALGHDKIEDWNDVGGVVDDLAVQTLVELEDVVAINLEHADVELSDLLDLLHVVAADQSVVGNLVVILPDFFEVVDEVFEFHRDVTRVYVRAPDDLGVRAHFIACTSELVVEHTSGRRFTLLCLVATVRIECVWVQDPGWVEEASLLCVIRHQSRRMEDGLRKFIEVRVLGWATTHAWSGKVGTSRRRCLGLFLVVLAHTLFTESDYWS